MVPTPVPRLSLVNQNISNTKYELQYTRWLLTVFGVWPMISSDMSKISKVSSFILIVLSLLISTIYTVIPFITVMRMKTFRARFTLLGRVSFRISCLLKLIALVYRADVIKDCINQMKSDWLKVIINDERNVMLKSVDFGRRLMSLSVAFMFSTGFFFHVCMPLLRPRRVNALNVTIRPHPYPYDFIPNSQVTPTYEIIFTAHCICATLSYFVTSAACNLAAVFVCHVSGQVEVIRLKLERLDDETDCVGEQIASIVRFHVDILR